MAGYSGLEILQKGSKVSWFVTGREEWGEDMAEYRP